MSRYLLKKSHPSEKPESKRHHKKKALAAEGKRWVDFVVPIATWELFVEKRCTTEKPNDVINKMIQEATL